MNTNSPIEIYTTEDGILQLDVRLENETVWLSTVQMASLFKRERSVLTKHINNVFKEGELDQESNVQILHISGADRPVKFYNLDVIISVGYRVKSKRGTQFRIWATHVLRQFLVEGYALNQKRLLEQQQGQMNKLQQAIRMISEMPERTALSTDEAASILKVLQEYSYALDILDQYNHQSVEVRHTQDQEETYRQIKKACKLHLQA